MAIRVVGSQKQPGKLIVVLRADNRSELTESPEARYMAINHAKEAGFLRPALTGNASPYAVDAKGEIPENYFASPEKIAAWQVNLEVVSTLEN